MIVPSHHGHHMAANEMSQSEKMRLLQVDLTRRRRFLSSSLRRRLQSTQGNRQADDRVCLRLHYTRWQKPTTLSSYQPDRQLCILYFRLNLLRRIAIKNVRWLSIGSVAIRGGLPEVCYRRQSNFYRRSVGQVSEWLLILRDQVWILLLRPSTSSLSEHSNVYLSLTFPIR